MEEFFPIIPSFTINGSGFCLLFSSCQATTQSLTDVLNLPCIQMQQRGFLYICAHGCVQQYTEIGGINLHPMIAVLISENAYLSF